VIKKIPSTVFWQVISIVTAIYTSFILAWSVSRWSELGVILWRSVWAGVAALYIAVIVGGSAVFFMLRKEKRPQLVDALEFNKIPAPFLKIVCGILFLAILAGVPWLKFAFKIGQDVKKPTFDPVLAATLFFWTVWWLILLASAALKIGFKISWAGALAVVFVLMGVSYQIFGRSAAVSDYPFSMGWSEASRYYYSSLYFARTIYGQSVALTSKSPARYLLQAIPFFISNLPLWAHRLWQYLLWILLTGGAAFALARRVIPDQRALRWLFAGWIFLYLLHVSVYFHLEVIVILVVWLTDHRSPRKSLLALLAASIWAGISRINWYPVPAMLGIAIYLLEEPVSSYKNLRDYLRRPFLWAIVGPVTAFLSQVIYVRFAGIQDLRAVTSSFSSDLLLYRLWPNDTYPMGIIPGILLVSAPLLIGLAQALWGRRQQLHFIRWFGLWAMLLVLFAGGLIVSIKIGGGGDIHNMDAFIVLLLIILGYFLLGQAKAENQTATWGNVSWVIIFTGLLLPVAFIIPSLSPLPQYNRQWNQSNLQTMQDYLTQVSAQGGEILFMNERHLLTFGRIKNIPLIPEYEVSNVMEMAMSGNQPYLDALYRDLRSQRFAAIVAGKQNVGIKDEGAFPEENNIWNTLISPYILCYYEPVVLLEPDISKIQIFTPRVQPGNCPK
jgi:hypothetical protein